MLVQPFYSQPTSGPVAAAPHPPAVRPRVRARRGQATDPHSIAERVNSISNFRIGNDITQKFFYELLLSSSIQSLSSIL